MSYKWILLSLQFCIISACIEENLPDDVESIAEKLHKKTCVLQSINLEMDNMWDSVSFQLQIELPDDMPKQERDNMVSVRNASLIRMFKRFDGLPEKLQSMVDSAGRADEQAVLRIQQIKLDISELESEKRYIFEALEKVDPGRLVRIKDEFDDRVRKPCPI